MEALEMHKAIGKEAIVTLKGLSFAVRVVSAKLAYGNVRFQVSPVSGKGLVWVDSSRVSFAETFHDTVNGERGEYPL